MEKISRRTFLKVAGATAITPVIESCSKTPAPSTAPSGTTAPAAAHPAGYTFLNTDEAGFIEAAVERLIPHDENGPGALDAGVPSYIDKTLAGAWGAGERLYRSGPWHQGTPQQGYQLPFTPAELFRHALRAINDDLNKTHKTTFAKLTPQDQEAYLKSLEAGGKDLDGVPSKVFFESLLSMTLEGYFSDPVYGGNKNMVAWKMIGFPGAYAEYYHLVDQYGIAYHREPMSIGENGQRQIKINPNIPAYMRGGGN